jgi:hypothetical protein
MSIAPIRETARSPDDELRPLLDVMQERAGTGGIPGDFGDEMKP